jgi:hypothetical protein
MACLSFAKKHWFGPKSAEVLHAQRPAFSSLGTHMTNGYLYVLSNPAMPGLLKIGRTDRQPEVRARELRTTGVPQPFVLEHFVQVEDAIKAEAHVHAHLQSKGARMSPDREFFNAELSVAVEVLNLVSAKSAGTPDFGRNHELSALAASIAPLSPSGARFEEVDGYANRLASIGRRGCPHAMLQAAMVFEQVLPDGARFKDFWREYLHLMRAYALWIPLASSNGRTERANVGRAVAEYIGICARHRWLIEEDFSFVSEFLVAGDQFQYEGYPQALSQFNLPEQLALRAVAL